MQRQRVHRGATNRERLLFRTDRIAGECWLWTGHTDEGGYAVLRAEDGRTRKAHRVAYEVFVGPLDDELQIDHLCRVRRCVNPEHLELVTAQVNTLRGETIAAAHAAVTHCPAGHEYTPENTYSSQRGERDCRTCRRRRSNEWARRKRLEAAA